MDTRCLVAAPDARRVETASGEWVLWGDPVDELERAVTAAESTADAVDALADAAWDAAAVRLGADGSVDAFRSATATRDVYTLEAEDAFVVTDAFRNAIAELDVDERRPADHAVVDHLLFRHPPEPDTYVAGVRAVEHGTWVHRDADGERHVELVDPLDANGGTTGADATGALETALETVLDDPGRAVNMLSGGVDSTLVHTFLGDSPTMVMAIDSPEFDYETDYAAMARDLLGVDGPAVDLAEEDFLEYLEASVDALGFPSHYNQTVLTDAAFRRTDPTTYVNGEGADALYGLHGVKGARFASWLSPLFALPGAETAWRASVGQVSNAAAALPETARSLDADPSTPASFAQRLPYFTDPDLVGRMTDPDLVRARHARTFDYVDERVRGTAGRRGFAAQVEHAHLQSLFRHNTVNQWRQLGYAHGHSLVAPFKARPVVDAGLAVPAAARYVGRLPNDRSLTPKHVPKSLLANRLPAYPVDQRKGAGSLPVQRYVEDGPLVDVFDRYDPPAFVPDSLRAGHVESYGPVTWNLVTWAVWRDRVLDDPDLDRLPGTEAIEVGAPPTR